MMPGPFVKAWMGGFEGARRGEPPSTNRHERGTEISGHWADGWYDGERARREAFASPQELPK